MQFKTNRFLVSNHSVFEIFCCVVLPDSLAHNLSFRETHFTSSTKYLSQTGLSTHMASLTSCPASSNPSGIKNEWVFLYPTQVSDDDNMTLTKKSLFSFFLSLRQHKQTRVFTPKIGVFVSSLCCEQSRHCPLVHRGHANYCNLRGKALPQQPWAHLRMALTPLPIKHYISLH